MALVFPGSAAGGTISTWHPVQELSEYGFAIAKLVTDRILGVPPMRPGLQYLANGGHSTLLARFVSLSALFASTPTLSVLPL